ncbi:glycoside hydrolase family 5 protein [Rhodopirellula sp. MGV]|uniref:glycoside hydrolase family 5 protein n=1 Tax=Rhodopirellula sp. MGV TaxID=2023130 RepID=UPI00130414A5|nr:glycoside hydrolase family 5 protein [Rhodopirellula sp. MGV]
MAVLFGLTSTDLLPTAMSQSSPKLSTAESTPLRLGSGINFGNMLDAPNEGDWGLRVNTDWFARVKEAGFDHVRLPISWGYHTAKTSPYQIDAQFVRRVDTIVKACLDADLKLLINIHHDPNLNEQPAQNHDRFVAMWKQIAEHFRSLPNDRVAFELLNEPHDVFNEDAKLWNQWVVDSLNVIRKSNPNRTVVVGPIRFNSVDSLDTLELPQDDNLVVTVHYYLPFDFTHQGAPWTQPVKPTGIVWNANTASIAGGWRNESWDTKTVGTTNGLQAAFERGWAGVQLRAASSRPIPQALELQVDSKVALKISLVSGEQKVAKDVTTAPGEPLRVTFDAGVLGGSFDRIYLQNNTANETQPFIVKSLSLVYADRKESLLSTAGDAIRDDLAKAARWGQQHGRAIYLGEFGAYQEADMDSRARWTAAVRAAAESLQMDWAYWEFASGFGIFDPRTQQYRQPLLNALQP